MMVARVEGPVFNNNNKSKGLERYEHAFSIKRQWIIITGKQLSVYKFKFCIRIVRKWGQKG
jgi:hypothetical protein